MKRPALILAAIYLIVAVAALIAWQGGLRAIPTLAVGYAALVVALSPVSFCAYALDKRAANRGRWRTAERTLHLLDLLGGWPGGVIAQQTLRHKSHKRSFRMILGLTIALHIVLVIALIWFRGAPSP